MSSERRSSGLFRSIVRVQTNDLSTVNPYLEPVGGNGTVGGVISSSTLPASVGGAEARL